MVHLILYLKKNTSKGISSLLKQNKEYRKVLLTLLPFL